VSKEKGLADLGWAEFSDDRGDEKGAGFVGSDGNRVRFLLPVEDEEGVRTGKSRSVLEVRVDGFYCDGEKIADEHWGMKSGHGPHDINVYQAFCEFLSGCRELEDVTFFVRDVERDVETGDDTVVDVEKLRIARDGFYVDGRKLDEGMMEKDHLMEVYWKFVGVLARERERMGKRVRELESRLGI